MDNKTSEATRVTVIIPCYNSAKSIRNVTDRIIEALDGRYGLQIILINDSSKDNVWDVIKDICREYKNVIGLSLSRNFGQQSARMAALPYVNGEYIVFMDDDGQHDPNAIPRLIEKIEEGYDIVYAYFRHKKESMFRRIGSDFARKTVDFIMGKPKEVHQSSFFVVKRFVIEELKNYHSPSPVILGYFMQITKNIAEVEVEHHERIDGRSGYTLNKLIRLWMNLFTSFSIVPLRIASLCGIIFSFIGLILGCTFVVKKLVFHMAPIGYTSLIAVILFSNGILMLLLGMLGEYIGRIFIALNDVPQYVVKEKVNIQYTEERENV